MEIRIEVAEQDNVHTLQEEASVYLIDGETYLMFTSEAIGRELEAFSQVVLELLVTGERQTFVTADEAFELLLTLDDGELMITSRNRFMERDEWAIDVPLFEFIEAYAVGAIRFVNLVEEVDGEVVKDPYFMPLVEVLSLLRQTVDGF